MKKYPDKMELAVGNHPEKRLMVLAKNIFPAKCDIVVMMDEEAEYFTSPIKEVSKDVEYISLTKFPKKILLWLTINEKGMSKPLFFSPGLALNEEI